jgi:hypothetical protein
VATHTSAAWGVVDTRVVVGAVIAHVIDGTGIEPCIMGGGKGFDNLAPVGASMSGGTQPIPCTTDKGDCVAEKSM